MKLYGFVDFCHPHAVAEKLSQGLIYTDLGPGDVGSVAWRLCAFDESYGPNLDQTWPLNTSVVKNLGLRQGDVVEVDPWGHILNQRPAKDRPFYPAEAKQQTKPTVWLRTQGMIQTDAGDAVQHLADVDARVLELAAPIGGGTRGLVVAPPKVGKTTVIQQVGHALSRNPLVDKTMVILFYERPEERAIVVRDPVRPNLRPGIPGAELWLIPYTEKDIQTAYLKAWMALARMMRLVEAGKRVVVLADSMTRLARLINAHLTDGKLGSGGIQDTALVQAKRWFGFFGALPFGWAAIVATVLVNTGNRGDDSIALEFLGTENATFWLSQEIANENVYPALDMHRSGTRDAHLLFGEDPNQARQLWAMYEAFLKAVPKPQTDPRGNQLPNPGATRWVRRLVEGTASNEELLRSCFPSGRIDEAEIQRRFFSNAASRLQQLNPDLLLDALRKIVCEMPLLNGRTVDEVEAWLAHFEQQAAPGKHS